MPDDHLFTFGLLLRTMGRVPLWMLVIPVFCGLTGTTTTLRLRTPEDAELLVAAVVISAMLAYRNRRLKPRVAVQ